MNNFFNFKKLKNINLNILLIIFILIIVGIFNLYSALGQQFYPTLLKQILYIVSYIPIIILIVTCDIDILIKNGYYFYFFSITLLIYNSLFGNTIMGARRWIKIFSFNFQVSEFVKIALILGLSKYILYTKNYINNAKIKTMSILLLMITIPFVFILKQPDLGSALLILFLGFSILYIIGIDIKLFLYLFCLFLILSPIIYKYGLHDYQRNRIINFIKKDNDVQNTGYNIYQSKITIGSGGLFGKGYANGSQNKLFYLPEKHTDFVFAIFCEENGFIFITFIIIIYSILILYQYFMAYKINDLSKKIIVFSCGNFLFIHLFVNIGMISGMLPVVGIPLPFFSYGGTIFIITFTFLALSFNIILDNSKYR